MPILIIVEILILVQYDYKEDARRVYYLDQIWEKYREKITQFVDADKIVFVDITSDWCVTCKFNKIMALDSIRTLDMFNRELLLQCETILLPKMMKYINS